MVLLLTNTALAGHHRSGPSCGCDVESILSVNEARIPSQITEWNCIHTGAPCEIGHQVGKVGNQKIHRKILIFRENKKKSAILMQKKFG